ncbi:MAG TPA: family 78 glycoside hydrolase catalytic domain, partial [Spirochaetia bacterium]|nr:family 78 glycoside hydrolase catalytic domain [Spirochaetia bacterium]
MIVQPIKLRTELSVHPINIDTQTPRLSWMIEDSGEHGLRQAAWQVELTDRTGKSLWNSGRKIGNECSTECVAGVLSSFSVYRWRVRCWSDTGAEGLSDWAYFETAALEREALVARWISHPNPSTYYEGSWESGVPNEKSTKDKSLHYPGIYCSKIFSLEKKKLRRARALVSGAGLYNLYLNGLRVSDEVLAPAQTDYEKRIFYSVYDIGPFIDEDRNEQCITLVLGNGRHIALYGFGKPRGYVQILLELEDGTIRFVCSDETWKICEGPLRENSIFNGECYDARLEVPRSAFDLVDAVQAEVVDGYPLQAAMIPPIRIEKRITPIKKWKQGDGFMYDFGQNFSGAVELKLNVPTGTGIQLSFAELIHPDGSLNPSSNREARCQDRYIARGKGIEIWQPTMTYHGFRYLFMEGYPGVPDSETVTGLFFHTEVEREGDFFCSHPLFNDIHRNILFGQLSNLMGIPTDSPQRDERHGWLGDALLSSEECIQNFGAVSFYEKYIQDIADTQNKDGSITDVAPKFWMKKPADPAW